MKKNVIVTGGSKGIGAQIVRELAELGDNVILCYNNSEQEAKQISNQYSNVDTFKVDVTKRDEVKKLMEYCVEKYGTIDVLINNAGISQIKMFSDITDEDWNKIIQTNLTSNFYTSQECLKYMVKEKKGCIINISSIWGQTGASCEVAYSVAKAGLDGLTKSLAKEYGLSNIRINSISPGIINTQMNSKLNAEDIEKIKEEIPLNKIGETKEISKCVKWLIEDEYTTGQIIGINGGWYI